MTIINKLKKLKDGPNFPDILLAALQEIEKKNEQLSLAKKYTKQQEAEIETLKFKIRNLKYRPESTVIFVQPTTNEERGLLKELTA
jgi:hypothetical protein